MSTDIAPEPYRSPLPYHVPMVTNDANRRLAVQGPATVQVAIQNEEPDTEDDLTLTFAFTEEGIIGDLYVSDGEPVATFSQTYEEFVGTFHRLDPATIPPVPNLDPFVEAIMHSPTEARVREVLAGLAQVVRR